MFLESLSPIKEFRIVFKVSPLSTLQDLLEMPKFNDEWVQIFLRFI